MTSAARPQLPLGMPASRKLSADELGLVILLLLDGTAGYGSQLSDRLATLSSDFYRPSPGVLYPVLNTLSGEGWVVLQRQGRRKVYHLTDTGRAHLDIRRREAEQVHARLERAGRKYRALREAMADIAGDEAQEASLAHEMLEARLNLKSLLHRSQGRPLATQRQILALLDDTARRLETLLDETSR